MGDRGEGGYLVPALNCLQAGQWRVKSPPIWQLENNKLFTVKLPLSTFKERAQGVEIGRKKQIIILSDTHISSDFWKLPTDV